MIKRECEVETKWRKKERTGEMMKMSNGFKWGRSLAIFQIEVQPLQFSSIPCKQEARVTPLLSYAILKTQIREKDNETETVLRCIYHIHRFVTFNEIERERAISQAKGFECCRSNRRWSSLDKKLNNIRFFIVPFRSVTFYNVFVMSLFRLRFGNIVKIKSLPFCSWSQLSF